ncbi:MAG: TonB-dependent receptor, partial [Saprospiraceae bacterium]|nr:TonB-dependent receptor [Saprospiraceae bacterium]
MKKLPLFSLLLLLSTVSWAQRPSFAGGGQRGPSITGKITGSVIDSMSEASIEFATIVLMKEGKQVNGIVSETDGSFKIMNVAPGTYDLQISFLGYQNKMIKGVETTLKNPDADVGTISLNSSSIDLGEVEVTGERGAFEAKIDKLVYNAEKDVSTAGGDASDVLARVPLLSIDSEGNVSLRGSQNLQILINGRPSIIFQGGSVGDALRTLSADQIKSVEVITVPTARYDGEGSGGIINIITKKKSVRGFTGTISGAVGNISNRGSVNLNYARNRFGLNVNGSGWLTRPRESFGKFYRSDFINGQSRILEQNSEGESQFYGPRFSLGATYEINAFNALTSSMTYRGFGRSNENVTLANFTDPSINLYQEYSRISEQESLRGGFDWTTDYRRTFNKKEQELAIAFQISGDQSNTDNILLQESLIDDDPSLFQNQRNENDGLNLETTFQVDYTHPFTTSVKMETGAKAILRTITSDFKFRLFDPDQSEYVTNQLLSDDFTYEQNVYAGYLSFNIKLSDKYSLIAGARYEKTDIAGSFEYQDSSNFTNNYDNFLPSLIISRQFGRFTSLRASYTKRIQRPGLRFVNPYIELSDPRDITQGNPNLFP